MVNQDVVNQFKLGLMSPVLTTPHINNFMDMSKMTDDQKAFHKMAMILRYSDKYNVCLLYTSCSGWGGNYDDALRFPGLRCGLCVPHHWLLRDV